MAALISEIIPLINGSVFGWSSIRVQFSNMTLPLIGVTSINYSDSREKSPIYGASDRPIAYGYGNVTYEASITLLKDEVKRIQDASPFGDITLLDSFDIIVSYRSDIAGKIQTETLKNVQFTSNPTSISQNDMSIEVELPLILAGIKRGNNPLG